MLDAAFERARRLLARARRTRELDDRLLRAERDRSRLGRERFLLGGPRDHERFVRAIVRAREVRLRQRELRPFGPGLRCEALGLGQVLRGALDRPRPRRELARAAPERAADLALGGCAGEPFFGERERVAFAAEAARRVARAQERDRPRLVPVGQALSHLGDVAVVVQRVREIVQRLRAAARAHSVVDGARRVGRVRVVVGEQLGLLDRDLG